eukprot:scaffold5612_cov46-Attheya_sp.AAC.3
MQCVAFHDVISDVLIRFPNRIISLHDVDGSDTFIHHTEHTLGLAGSIGRQSSDIARRAKAKEQSIHPTPNFNLMTIVLRAISPPKTLFTTDKTKNELCERTRNAMNMNDDTTTMADIAYRCQRTGMTPAFKCLFCHKMP